MQEKTKKKRKDKPKVVFAGPTKQYICLTCPNCCALETDGTQVSGHKCEKGQTFACQEWLDPLRVITTTIRVDTKQGMHIVPVKTAAPVPLTKIPAIMKTIKSLRLLEVPPLGSVITVDKAPEPLEIVVTGE
jgi:CxxC motif-containing protein